MIVRDYQSSDYAQVLSLTCDTFQPFYEESFPAHMGYEAELVDHQHGHWREDYQRQLPELFPLMAWATRWSPPRTTTCSAT